MCSTAVRHHRTALSGPPLHRGLVRTFLRPPGGALSRRSRLPLSVALLRREVRCLHFAFAYLYSGRGLNLPRGITVPFCALQWYATTSSTCTGAAWWTPGGDNGARGRRKEQGALDRGLRGYGRAVVPHWRTELLIRLVRWCTRKKEESCRGYDPGTAELLEGTNWHTQKGVPSWVFFSRVFSSARAGARLLSLSVVLSQLCRSVLGPGRLFSSHTERVRVPR